jgi:hypothetical protein
MGLICKRPQQLPQKAQEVATLTLQDQMAPNFIQQQAMQTLKAAAAQENPNKHQQAPSPIHSRTLLQTPTTMTQRPMPT